MEREAQGEGEGGDAGDAGGAGDATFAFRSSRMKGEGAATGKGKGRGKGKGKGKGAASNRRFRPRAPRPLSPDSAPPSSGGDGIEARGEADPDPESGSGGGQAGHPQAPRPQQATSEAPKSAPRGGSSNGGTRLSFAEERVDEEEEAPTFTKPISRGAFAKPAPKGKRSQRKLLRNNPSTAASSSSSPSAGSRPSVVTQRSAAGEYTPEKLAELRKNSTTFYFSSSVHPSRAEDEDDGMDEQHHETSGGDSEAREINANAISITDEDEERILLEAEEAKRASEANSVRTLSHLRNEEVPSHTAVLRAKATRQRRRDHGDYIPLEETTAKGDLDEAAKSRLVRDDDEDDAAEVFDDHRGGKILFGDPKARERQQQSEKVAILRQFEEQAPDEEEEEDDAVRRWELEQIRKGVRGKNLKVRTLRQMKEQQKDIERRKVVNAPAVTSSQDAQALGALESGALEESSRPMESAEDIHKRMTQKLAALKERNQRDDNELRQLKQSVLASESNIENLKNSLKRTSDDFDYYQQLRDYMLDLIDCMREKGQVMDNFEKKIEQLDITRFQQLRRQRDQENEFVVEEIERESGGTKNFREEATDEFGRDLKLMARRSREARRERRERRKAERQAAEEEDEEGWSSEEESGEQKENYERRKGKILGKARASMEEVVEEFSSLREIKRRFESWRASHPQEYFKCFASLSIPEIITPLIKLDSLEWTPLQTLSFEDLPWYQIIQDFAIQPTSEGEQQQDRDVVPRIISRVILPRAARILSHGWDPLSRTQTVRARAMVSDLLVYVTDPTDVKNLCVAALGTMQAAIDQLRVPMHYLGMTSNAMAPSFAMKMFRSGLKLMGNLMSWHQQLSNRTLKNLALNKLFNNTLLPFMRQIKFGPPNQGLTRFLGIQEKILSMIPTPWIRAPADKGTALAAELGLWHQFVVQATRNFKKEEERLGESGCAGPKEWQRARQLLERLCDPQEASKY